MRTSADRTGAVAAQAGSRRSHTCRAPSCAPLWGIGCASQGRGRGRPGHVRSSRSTVPLALASSATRARLCAALLNPSVDAGEQDGLSSPSFRVRALHSSRSAVGDGALPQQHACLRWRSQCAPKGYEVPRLCPFMGCRGDYQAFKAFTTNSTPVVPRLCPFMGCTGYHCCLCVSVSGPPSSHPCTPGIRGSSLYLSAGTRSVHPAVLALGPAATGCRPRVEPASTAATGKQVHLLCALWVCPACLPACAPARGAKCPDRGVLPCLPVPYVPQLPVRVRRHAKRASTSTPPDAPHRTPRSTPPFAREACIRPAALSALPCGA